MSVNSKMTAIADKIRSLLGISGTMGLDAMATNLTTEQTNVFNAFTAVGSKGGTVPSSKVSGNLAAAISSIPLGVTVQQASGTFTVNSSNTFTVDIGFKPDILILYDDINFTGINYLIETNDGYSCLFDGKGKGLFYNMYPYQRLEGFGCTMWLVNYSLEWIDSFEDTTFSYVAYKIT